MGGSCVCQIGIEALLQWQESSTLGSQSVVAEGVGDLAGTQRREHPRKLNDRAVGRRGAARRDSARGSHSNYVPSAKRLSQYQARYLLGVKE